MMIVAEIGVAWNGDRARIPKFIEAAALAGATHVKFQAFNAAALIERRKIAPDAMLQDRWNVCDLLRRCELTNLDLHNIHQYAEHFGIKWFCSVFDPSQVERVLRYGACALKIGHAEAHDPNHEMHYACEKYRSEMLPVWRSTDPDKSFGNVCCVCEYPADKHHPRLSTVGGQHGYKGYSSHYTDWRIPAAAALRGAEYIEAHFKLSDDDPEAPWSLCWADFEKMVKQIRLYESWL